MFLPQDELLYTKFLATKTSTFTRGNFHSVSGGIIWGYFLSPIRILTFNMTFYPKIWLNFPPYWLHTQIASNKKREN
jgi:hypothetical protein